MSGVAIDWNDLRVLLALWRADSFAGAARALKVDQSTVSRRLSTIEKAVGMPLLIRGVGEYSWTSVGKKMVDAALKAESAIRHVEQEVRSEKQEPVGRVRVAIPPGLIASLAPWFEADAGEASLVDIAFSGCVEPWASVYADTDIVLSYSEPSVGDLVSQIVYTENFAVYASKTHIAIYGEPAGVGELKSHPLVACGLKQIQALNNWLSLAGQMGVHDRVTVVDNLQSAEQLVCLGYGLGALPVSQACSNPLLQRIDTIALDTQFVYLSYHVSQKGSSRVQAAVKRLRLAFKSMDTAHASLQSANALRLKDLAEV